MAVKTEKDLSADMQAHWLKAVAAIELRNFAYAISLLQAILKQEPEFLTGRQLLRRTEVAKLKSTKKSFFNLSTASVSVMKAQREIKKDPANAVVQFEKILEDEPQHKQTNLALKEAAVAAGWLETAVFALQTALEGSADDTKVMHELAKLYSELGDHQHEVQTYLRISELDPADAEAARRGKDASARGSMKSGGWGQAESYRDLIRDKEAAVSLEQQNRMTLTGESLDQQIAETYAAHQADPQNLDLAKRLGTLSEQKDELESAVAWFRYAADLAQGNDPGLGRKISDLETRQMDRSVAVLEEEVSGMSADALTFAGKTAALAEAKKKRASLLVDDARKRVERNPTDLQFRFELGENLMEAGQFRDALPELQRARQNPNARLKAMNALGRCYRELGMFDLAAKQLEEAASEILSMDPMKKDIVYNLGLVYAQMGDAEKSLAAMKQIYEADYGYRDVATRVESSYTRGGG